MIWAVPKGAALFIWVSSVGLRHLSSTFGFVGDEQNRDISEERRNRFSTGRVADAAWTSSRRTSQGLIEQLDEEVAALAGRGRDHGQRAMVLHHLYDHSRGGHVWALAEARRALRTAAGLAALRRRIDRWGWIGRQPRSGAGGARAICRGHGRGGRARAAAAYRAYRLSATPALRDDAEAELAARPAGRSSTIATPPDGPGRACRRKLGSHWPMKASVWPRPRLMARQLGRAWAAIDATGLRRAAGDCLATRRLPRRGSETTSGGWRQ